MSRHLQKEMSRPLLEDSLVDNLQINKEPYIEKSEEKLFPVF